MRGIGRAFALLSVLVLAGCSSGGGSSSRSASPSMQEGKADVGGYSLAWECQGSGSPTLILEAGYDSSGEQTWANLMDRLAQTTRVCTYDRAGTGVSDYRPTSDPITSQDQAAELHRMLAEAGIDPPYVVVGHSYGGFISRAFAAAYPDETTGLVLLDSSHEDEIVPYRRYYKGKPAGDWVDGDTPIDIDATVRSLQSNARDFGDLPLVVVKAGRYEDVLTTDLWDRTQADLATLSDNSLFVQASGGHFIMRDDPDAVVAAARAVVEAARTGEPLPTCEEFITNVKASCPKS